MYARLFCVLAHKYSISRCCVCVFFFICLPLFLFQFFRCQCFGTRFRRFAPVKRDTHKDTEYIFQLIQGFKIRIGMVRCEHEHIYIWIFIFCELILFQYIITARICLFLFSFSLLLSARAHTYRQDCRKLCSFAYGKFLRLCLYMYLKQNEDRAKNEEFR